MALNRIPAAALLLTLLTACNTTLYVPQAGESAARLRLVTRPLPKYHSDGGRLTTLWVDDLSACPQRPRRVLDVTPQSDGEARLGMPMPADPARLSAEYLIPAGKPLAVTVFGGRGLKTCQISVRMTPTAGQDYEVESAWDEAQKRCLIKLVRWAQGTTNTARRLPLGPSEALKIDSGNLCEAGQ